MGHHLQGQNRGMEVPQLILAHVHRLDGHVEFGVACRARTGAWVCLTDPGAHTQGGHVDFVMKVSVDADMIDGMGAGMNLDLPQQNPRTGKS
jgi:hypothetical protein